MRARFLVPTSALPMAVLVLAMALALPPSPAYGATYGLTANMTSVCGSPTASGTASMTYNDATNVLMWSITFSNLSSNANAGHLHNSNTNGIEIPLFNNNKGTSGTVSGTTAPITEARETLLLSGKMYAQIHTDTCGSGEILGTVTQSVGGVAGAPDIAGSPLQAGDASGPGAGLLAGTIAGAAATALVVGGSVWYASRRRSRSS